MSLPRLPLPAFQRTVEGYRRALSSMLSGSRLAAAEKELNLFVEEQARAAGPSIQSSLEWFDSTQTTNYSEYFMRNRVLRSTAPLVRSSSGFVVLNGAAPNPGVTGSALAAISSAVDLYLKSRENSLPSWDFKGQNISSDLASRLFCTTRLAVRGERKHRDEFKTFAGVRHVTVLNGDVLHRVDVVDRDGRPVDAKDISATLASIVGQDRNALQQTSDVHGIHALNWAERDKDGVRSSLESRGEDATMAQALIDLSIVHVVLDQSTSPSLYKDGMAKSLLNGTRVDPRASEKSMEVRVFKNGRLGVSYEAGALDLYAVAHYCQDVMEKLVSIDDASATGTAQVKSITIPRVNPAEVLGMDQHMLRASTCLLDGEGKGFGKEFAKRHRFSPSAFMRVLIPLAYRRMTYEMPNAEERVLMGHYANSRDEVIKTLTPETAELLDLMLDSKKAPHKLLKAQLYKAMEAQQKLVEECRGGDGAVNHMAVLEEMAHFRKAQDEEPYDIPEFFNGEGYNFYTNSVDVLSSNATCSSVGLHGVSPKNGQGYGVGYVVDDQCIRVSVSAAGGASAEGFAAWIFNMYSDLLVLFE